MTTFGATILSWVDGDTCRALVALPLGVCLEKHVRLYGMNSPELHGVTAVAGQAAKAAAEVLIPPGSTVILTNHGEEKYGRLLGALTLADGRDFAATMIAQGHAVPYDGGPR